ncbi:MAG TPA: hypothetical protein VLU46_08655 [Thermoanaerobaculia bacterium]|nr:hypothetical protein [Thermoanaerobaculia bacterium]
MEKLGQSDRIWLAVFVFVVAPIGAAVAISVLLLFGASPPLVFTPGRALVGGMARVGIHVPRAFGVLATVASFWFVIVVLGLLFDRLRGYPRIGA